MCLQEDGFLGWGGRVEQYVQLPIVLLVFRAAQILGQQGSKAYQVVVVTLAAERLLLRCWTVRLKAGIGGLALQIFQSYQFLDYFFCMFICTDFSFFIFLLTSKLLDHLLAPVRSSQHPAAYPKNSQYFCSLSPFSQGYIFSNPPRWAFSHSSLLTCAFLTSSCFSSRVNRSFFPVSILFMSISFEMLTIQFFYLWVMFIRTRLSLMTFFFMSLSRGVSVEKLGVQLTSSRQGLKDQSRIMSRPRIQKHMLFEQLSGWQLLQWWARTGCAEQKVFIIMPFICFHNKSTSWPRYFSMLSTEVSDRLCPVSIFASDQLQTKLSLALLIAQFVRCIQTYSILSLFG